MRIIGGEWRGRPIRAPKGDATRPTTDRVRESLFDVLVSRLGPSLGSPVVLDPFAGSGALGLEALSRGAQRAVFLEKSRGALSALETNISGLDAGERATVVHGDAFSLAGRVARQPFSLILLDPPYRLDPAKVTRWLTELADAGVLCDDAMITWEHSSDTEINWPETFVVDTVKAYGGTRVEFARWKRGPRDS